MIAAILLAATSCLPTTSCTPTITTACATPTATFTCIESTDNIGVVGYAVLVKKTGDPAWTLVASTPCVPYIDEDGQIVSSVPKWCQATSEGVPIQRFGDFVAGTQYDLCFKAFDAEGNFSVNCSNTVTWCPSPIWTGPPAAYN